MAVSRRRFLNTSALAAAGIAAPHLFIPGNGEASAATFKKGEPIKIGLLFSLTGALAVPEEDSTLVMQYAIDEINKNGGIAGHQKSSRLSSMRSRTSVSTRKKTKELILRDKVIAIFGCLHLGEPQGDTADRHVAKQSLVLPDLLRRAECTQNDICTGPLANQHSKDLIPYMVKNFGKKVFFVGSNYVWPKESNKNAKVWLENAGGELVGEEYIPLGSSEFGPVLGKIRDRKPNFIFSTVVGASDIAFHKQFKQEGFKVDVMPIASLTTGEIETRAMGNELRRRPLPLGALLPGAR